MLLNEGESRRQDEVHIDVAWEFLDGAGARIGFGAVVLCDGKRELQVSDVAQGEDFVGAVEDGALHGGDEAELINVAFEDDGADFGVVITGVIEDPVVDHIVSGAEEGQAVGRRDVGYVGFLEGRCALGRDPVFDDRHGDFGGEF